jgi:hypothetical protein
MQGLVRGDGAREREKKRGEREDAKKGKFGGRRGEGIERDE